MAFSFVHAADLQLGSPLFGVADLPDRLRDRMIDARYRAARNLFDAALTEQVDCVILAGGVLAANGSPRGMWFFVEQCERLARADIPVYWIERDAERQPWPQYVPLPGNVYLSNPEIGQTYEQSNATGATAAVLTGDALQADVRGDSRTLRIGVLPDATADELPDAAGVDYWALGGRSEPGAVPVKSGLAQYCGTTQGDNPDEPGLRGCVLVRTDGRRVVSSQFVQTASICWMNEHLTVDGAATWESLRRELHDRAATVGRGAQCDAVMLRWTLEGHGVVWRQLLRDEVCEHLLDELREEFAGQSPAVWSLLVQPVADARQWEEWRGEQSALGEAARALASESESDEVVHGAAASRPTFDATHQGIAEPHFGDGLRDRIIQRAARRERRRPSKTATQ